MDATVAGALIGVGGVVVGAAIGAGSSLLLARQQRKALREDRELLLWAEERRDAYVRFLGEATKLETAITKPGPDRTVDIRRFGPLVGEEVAPLMAAYDEIRLISPKYVVEPARTYMYELTWGLASAYTSMTFAYEAQPQDPAHTERAESSITRAIKDVREWEHKTRAAMRKNLGTGPEFDLPEPKPRRNAHKSEPTPGTTTPPASTPDQG